MHGVRDRIRIHGGFAVPAVLNLTTEKKVRLRPGHWLSFQITVILRHIALRASEKKHSGVMIGSGRGFPVLCLADDQAQRVWDLAHEFRQFLSKSLKTMSTGLQWHLTFG